MRRYSNNWVFIDLLFNLLVGFTSLFIIAFILINPIAKNATIDPPVVFIVECVWDVDSDRDIDLYIKGPNGTIVYFGNKDGAYMVLERDDLGYSNDTFIMDNREVSIPRNFEMITMSQLPPGEYTVNVHYYSYIGEPETVEVRATQVAPFNIVADKVVEIVPRQEKTIVNFYVNEDGTVSDVRTDLNLPIRPVGIRE